MSTAVEIAGVGIHAFGRFGEKTVVELGVAAVRAALDDAGISRGGFQAAFCDPRSHRKKPNSDPKISGKMMYQRVWSRFDAWTIQTASCRCRRTSSTSCSP